MINSRDIWMYMKSKLFFTKGLLIAFIIRMHIMKRICWAPGHLSPGSLFFFFLIKNRLVELWLHGINLRDTLARHLSPCITIPTFIELSGCSRHCAEHCIHVVFCLILWSSLNEWVAVLLGEWKSEWVRDVGIFRVPAGNRWLIHRVCDGGEEVKIATEGKEAPQSLQG